MPRVTFAGEKKSGTFPAGTTILEAAIGLRVPMTHVCNGGGTCATCRFECIKNPENLTAVERNECLHELPGRQRLGCQARIHGDVEVKVLPVPGTTVL